MISQAYLDRLEMIESGGNPLARNKLSSAKGPYQFIDSTAKQYGLKDPFNRDEARKAVTALSTDNYNYLKKKLGRAPTEGELYLAHQQGAGGAAKLLMNPDAKAKDLVGQDAIKNNRGREDMTAQEFAELWVSKFPADQLNGAEGDNPVGTAGEDTLGLTPEEEAELAALEAELGETETVNKLTPEEQAELDALEAELGGKEAPKERSMLEKGVNLAASYAQGRTFGAGPKIASAIGTLPAKAGAEIAEAITGNEAPSIKDIYKSGVDLYSAPVKAAREDNPKLALATELAGGIKTGVQFGKSSLGGKVAGLSPRVGGVLQKMGIGPKTANVLGKSAVQGVLAESAFRTYQAGEAPVGQEIEELTSREVPVAGILGGALPIVGAGVGFVSKKLTKAALATKTSEQLRKEASAVYQSAKQKGGVLKPETTNKWIDNLDNMQPSSERVRKIGGTDKFSQVLDDIKTLYRNQAIDFDEAQQIDERLSNMITYDLGKMTKDGKQIFDIQTALRETIESASDADVIGGKEGFEALKQGRKIWSQSLKLRDIERIIERSELSEQPSTALRTGFRTLLNNPNRIKGYSKAEREAIRKAAKLGGLAEITRVFGSRLGPLIAGGAGGPAAAGASYLGATASRGIANSLQMNKAQNVADLISSGGALKQRQIQPFLGPTAGRSSGVLSGATTGVLQGR